MMKNRIQNRLSLYILLTVLFLKPGFVLANQNEKKVFDLKHFDKVIISPYIKVFLKEGDTESLEILESKVSLDELVIENKSNKLEVYLKGARNTTRQEKVKRKGKIQKVPLYREVQLVLNITYTSLNELQAKGDEEVTVLSDIKADNFNVKGYGDGKISFQNVEINTLKGAFYGDGELNISGGTIENQHFSLYGDAKVDLINVENKYTSSKMFGGNKLKVNTQNELKVSGIGDFLVEYKGDPIVKKGINIGDGEIVKVE
ncbi:GIN domain-containing protein [Xanthovirga aplysinae]|uniref:GIN domain-containing protein n=1 Tax=Xanthovirga aplysinae TaxID=2529853 RepID=UPI0012BBB84C|nr:DUF2807 domain-containing protein [Xanthovirga aplysinae]MTI30748.1 DUF2807 domain-containing protein [Xanthovirga aplysinae]